MSSPESFIADPLVRWCADVLAGESLAQLAMSCPHDEEAVLRCAESQGVAALMADVLTSSESLLSPPLRSIQKALQGRGKSLAILELSRRARAQHVLGVLAEAGIPVLVLKGMALGYWLYPSPVQRPGADVDLLVPDLEAAEQGVAALLAGGYRLVDGVIPARSSGLEVTLRFSARHDHEVDLHWQLLNHARLARGFGFAELSDAAIALPALVPGARGLGPLHALAHALLHRVASIPSGRQNRLIWLYDIHLLAARLTESYWKDFLRLCAQKSIDSSCHDGLAASQALLRTPLPDGLLDAMRRQAAGSHWQLQNISGRGALDRAHWMALPWRERMPWMWRKLFPPPAFMRYRYGVDGFWSLVTAYARRVWVGVGRLLGK